MHEVITRWHQLFKGTLVTQQYIRGEVTSSGITDEIREFVLINDILIAEPVLILMDAR